MFIRSGSAWGLENIIFAGPGNSIVGGGILENVIFGGPALRDPLGWMEAGQRQNYGGTGALNSHVPRRPSRPASLFVLGFVGFRVCRICDTTLAEIFRLSLSTLMSTGAVAFLQLPRNGSQLDGTKSSLQLLRHCKAWGLNRPRIACLIEWAFDQSPSSRWPGVRAQGRRPEARARGPRPGPGARTPGPGPGARGRGPGPGPRPLAPNFRALAPGRHVFGPRAWQDCLLPPWPRGLVLGP